MRLTLKERIGLCGFVFLLVLNLGALRKQEDPIVNTQTNPILHKEKIEEIKDGEKGAPSPSFTHYEHPDFLSEPPVGREKEQAEILEAIPSPEDEIPEAISELNDDDWLEDSWFKDEKDLDDDYGDLEGEHVPPESNGSSEKVKPE